MNHATRKTLDSLTQGRAPRDLRWADFVSLWQDVADGVETESGDRLAVTMNGHRVVFRRAHDGLVSLEDVEHARTLLKDRPEPESAAGGTLYAVALDDKRARIFAFDLAEQGTVDEEKDVSNPDRRARRMRAVEHKDGHDDEQTLERYFDDVASELVAFADGAPFVVLSHGTGKADAGPHFVERLKQRHAQLAERVSGTAHVDLSAASDADLEAAARQAAHR